MSSCDCHIELSDASQKGVLRKLFALNAFMFVAELAVGIIGQSTGVIADSLYMLADPLVYGVALYAVGRCSSIKTRAALLSGVFQVLIALGIDADIIRRAVTGSDPSSLLMFIVSIIAIVRVIIYLTGSRWPDLIIGAITTIVVLRGGIQILANAREEKKAME